MSVPTRVKLFVLINATCLLFYFMSEKSVEVSRPVAMKRPNDKPKYILEWNMKGGDSLRSQSVSVERCSAYPQCVMTQDAELLPDPRLFDAVVFRPSLLSEMSLHKLPEERSHTQKYIFAADESAHNYPMCNPHYDSYFNWTWTYRLDSDLRWRFFTVYDLQGQEVGPKTDMKWLPTVKPINKDVRLKLSSKSKAAAWFVSHCKTRSQREEFVSRVTRELGKYNLSVDVYGKCNKNHKCPRNHWFCNLKLQTDYYFYFAFENSFDDDYITEKFLAAFSNLAVPVMYGGANYSRFLPPGSYLDGRVLGAEQLARTMRDIIHNRSRYEDMFRWRNYYRFQEPFLLDMCDLCAKLYDEAEVERVTVWNHFRVWWNSGRSWCRKWNRKHRTCSTTTECSYCGETGR